MLCVVVNPLVFKYIMRDGNENVPARQAMALYFEGLRKDMKGRQGNLCSIPSVLSDDYKNFKAFNKVSKLNLNLIMNQLL